MKFTWNFLKNWKIRFVFILVILTGVFYAFHYILFHDAYWLSKYTVFEIGFLPIDVIIVTLILDEVIAHREKQQKLKKLNMVIGSFYSEVGLELLKYCAQYDQNIDKIQAELGQDKEEWTQDFFEREIKKFKNYNCDLQCNRGFSELKEFLLPKREFLLGLMENPNLLEHERFTDLLFSVFHLMEELAHRENVDNLSPKDHEHIINDYARVYRLLIEQWLQYMRHLKEDYPYLFSLSIRLNPFNPNAKAEIEE